MKVLLAYGPDEIEWSLIRSTWPSECEIVMRSELDRDGLQQVLPEIDAVVGHMTGIESLLGHLRNGDIGWINDAKKLRLIHTVGHGVDVLAAPVVADIINEREIIIARANPAAITVAEFAIMSMISISRRVTSVQSLLVNHGDWSSSAKAAKMDGGLGGELYHSVLGLVGYGSIATEIHQRAKAFGMTVGAVTQTLRGAESGLDFSATSDQLDDFLGRCDYVVLALALTEATRNLFDEGRFQAMKDGSYLVNISRGALVDEVALYAALQTGKLAGAAIDTWPVEEVGGTPDHGYPSRYPMHQYNVLMTPHYASATKESRSRAIEFVGENLRLLLDGKPLKNVAAV